MELSNILETRASLEAALHVDASRLLICYGFVRLCSGDCSCERLLRLNDSGAALMVLGNNFILSVVEKLLTKSHNNRSTVRSPVDGLRHRYARRFLSTAATCVPLILETILMGLTLKVFMEKIAPETFRPRFHNAFITFTVDFLMPMKE